MRKRKSERRDQFIEVSEQIQMIKNEIYGSTAYISSKEAMDEADLSLRKLEEFHSELLDLQKDKVEMITVSLFVLWSYLKVNVEHLI